MLTKNLKLFDKYRAFNPCTKDGYNYNSRIPDEYSKHYQEAIARFSHQYDFIAESFHKTFPEPPFTWEDFLVYMKKDMGLSISTLLLDGKKYPRLAGTWCWKNSEKSEFLVFLNDQHPWQKQKVTAMHESIHAIQDFDQEFKVELSTYPLSIQSHIADRIAEKAAIEILLPRAYVAEDKACGLTSSDIAQKYDISQTMAKYA